MQKYLRPGPASIPFSNRRYWYHFPKVTITNQKKTEIPFSSRRYWQLFSQKNKKDTEIPFSNEVPITNPEKTWKFHFQIEDIDIIFQRLPSQAKKNNGHPVFSRRYWHYFPEVPITSPKKGKSRFQIEDIGIIFQRLPSQAKKETEIPFSNRRYWHYFPEKSKKTRKSRFQMRFPSQAQKKHGNSIFK